MAQKEGNGLILYSASGLTARAHARELLTLAVTVLFLATQRKRYGYGV